MSGRYVAIGDSFTEGVGDANLLYPNGVRGWADRVARQLGRCDARWRYANLAIRSKRLDEIVEEQFEAALALDPTLITYYAGGNDILAVRADMASIMRRYEASLRRLTATGAQVVVFTTFDGHLPPAVEPLRRRITVYNDGVRELAARLGVHVVDHATFREFDDRRMWALDRIHMSKVGHKHLAARVLGELGVPHSLHLPELPPFERPDWRQTLANEKEWVTKEVVPLFRRRINGVREGDSLPPKWPELVRPAEGMKRLARARAGDAMAVHAETAAPAATRETQEVPGHHPAAGGILR